MIPKYLAIFNNRKVKHIILTSGRAGTKSSYAAIRTDYQVVSDPHGSAVVLRKHHNKLRKTVYKEMIRGINRLGISKKKFAITKSPMEITYKKYGTTIYFSGSDGIDDTKGIIDEDKPIKLVVLDELTEFFDDGEGEDELSNIEATFVRGNSSGFQMIYLYNPPKNPNAPINQWCKKMEKREDCIHIHTDYRDVPVSWLGQALVDSAEAMKRADEKMYRWVWLGQAVGVDATTFEAFGLDTYRKKFPGLGEYYHSGRESGRQKSPSEYAQDLVEFMNELHEQYDNRVFYIFLDPSAKGLAEEVRRAVRAVSLDYQVFLRDAENDVALGISRVQKVLCFDIMSVSPKQEYAVSEFGTYEYDKKSIEKGKEVPVKEDDHCMDAIRYCVMGAWKRLKYWLPKDETEEIDVCDISRKEVEDDEYL